MVALYEDCLQLTAVGRSNYSSYAQTLRFLFDPDLGPYTPIVRQPGTLRAKLI
jgi:hypothetical protein